MINVDTMVLMKFYETHFRFLFKSYCVAPFMFVIMELLELNKTDIENMQDDTHIVKINIDTLRCCLLDGFIQISDFLVVDGFIKSKFFEISHFGICTSKTYNSATL